MKKVLAHLAPVFRFLQVFFWFFFSLYFSFDSASFNSAVVSGEKKQSPPYSCRSLAVVEKQKVDLKV